MFGLGALLVGGAVLLGGALVLNALEEDARDAQRRWRNESEKVKQSVEHCNREIERRLASARESLEFERLCNLHYESMKIADLAYRALKNNRTVLAGLNTLLRDSIPKRDGLKRTISNASGREKLNLKHALHVLFQYRRQVFSARDKAWQEGKTLLKKVRKLNQNTHALKLEIRDNCGQGGDLWYRRLKERSRNRRLLA